MIHKMDTGTRWLPNTGQDEKLSDNDDRVSLGVAPLVKRQKPYFAGRS